MTSSRYPSALPGYKLGDEGRPAHFTATIPRETAASEAKDLEVGDAAFILRSGYTWTYATVTEKEEKDGTTLRFEVDADKNKKTFPEAVWGKYVRVIKVGASEMAKLKAEAGEVDTALEEANVLTKVAEPKQEEERKALVLGEFSSEVGSWFSSKWNSKNKGKYVPAGVVSEKQDIPHAMPPSLSLESEDKPAVTATKVSPSLELEDEPVAKTNEETKSKHQIGSLLSMCGKLEEPTAAPEIGSLFSSMCGTLEEPKIGEIPKPKLAMATPEPNLGSMFSSMFGKKTGEPTRSIKKNDEVKADTVIEVDKDKSKAQTDESKIVRTKTEKTHELEPATSSGTTSEENKSPDSNQVQGESPEVTLLKPAPYTDETRDDNNEEGETAKPKPAKAATKEKKKLKPQLGTMLSSMFGNKSGVPKSNPEKNNGVEASAVTQTDKDTSTSKLAQTKIEKIGKSESTPVSLGTATEVNKSPDFSLAQEKAPVATLQEPAPLPDERREVGEEQPSFVSAAPTKMTPDEGKPILAPVIQAPIKLLKTPFKFYKAASMKEDSAAAALAATSFADEQEDYGSIRSNGVIVCMHDPAAAVTAEILAQERERGSTEIKENIDSDAELKRQGVVIVETE